MASHIPFISAKIDCELVKSLFIDSEFIRVSLENIDNIKKDLPKKIPLWIDSAIDGYDQLLRERGKWADFEEYLNQYEESKLLADNSFIKRPEKKKLQKFVNSVLNRCLLYKPTFITVPQIPIVNDSSRNNINRALASATFYWKQKANYKDHLILPIIFTHQDQLKGKVQWKPKLAVASSCYDKAGADYVWVVDSSLNDQKGSATHNKRFPKFIEFHRDLKEAFSVKTKIIAGPYWALNLVLWIRGLCDHPAINIGSGYQYHISGGFRFQPNIRLAIPPLRRWVTASLSLSDWLEEALKNLSHDDPARKELSYLKKSFKILSQREAAKRQAAKFYKTWFDKILAVSSPGRALALYQDLSTAYVIGKQLPILPESEKPGRNPERIAQQLMLICL